MSKGSFGGSPAAAFSVSAGAPFALTVTASDAYGNMVTAYRGTVRFSSSDPSAELPADYMFQAADQGSHIFSNVVLNTKGKQTISIADMHSGSLTGGWIVTVE